MPILVTKLNFSRWSPCLLESQLAQGDYHPLLGMTAVDPCPPFLDPSVHCPCHSNWLWSVIRTTPLLDHDHRRLSTALAITFRLFTLLTHKSPVPRDPWTLLRMHFIPFFPHLLPCGPLNRCAGPWICWSSFTIWGLPLCQSFCRECSSSLYLLPSFFTTFQAELN